MTKNDKGTVLSAFSGVGGMDLGLSRAGFRCVACIENDPIARESLIASEMKWPVLQEGDVSRVARSLAPATVGLRPRQLTLLAGGPPCQPFSKAAQWAENGRTGMGDPRARPLGGFLKLAETFLPHAILIENVEGFVRGREEGLSYIERRLRQINRAHGTAYSAQHRVIDAADFGVPQHRKRALVVAMRSGDEFVWPTATHEGRPVRAWDAIGDINVLDAPRLKGKFADVLRAIPEGKNYLHFTSRGEGGYELFGYRTRYWSFLLKLAKAEPSWTLAAHPGPSTGPFHWDNRPLSVVEMLRLQTFPARWAVAGNYRAQVRQVGNATPPLLAEVLGHQLLEQVAGVTKPTRPSLAIGRRRMVPAARSAAQLPHSWQRQSRPRDAHPGTGKGPRPRTD